MAGKSPEEYRAWSKKYNQATANMDFSAFARMERQPERNKGIALEFSNGATVKDLAGKYRLSTTRIIQIIKAADL